MNTNTLIFLFINAVTLLLVPRRFAPLPLLAGTLYMSLSQVLEIGPLTFSVIRILIAVGFIRAIIRGESIANRLNALDKLMLLFCIWAVSSSLFYENLTSALTLRLGFAYNACGIYFLLRIFCKSLDDLILLTQIIAILLVPLSLEMLYERYKVFNLFHVFGAPQVPAIRSGTVRAQGPFAHPILAGTVGAACLPVMIGLWNHRRKSAISGMAAALIMVIACNSSGPIMSSIAALGALFMWRFRKHMQVIRWLAVLSILMLDLVMKAPVYFLIARVDLTGGSTGWHRAQLIHASIYHLSEWWLAGTDYTRHWMPTGVSWSANHTDITNYYIKLGVLGGLPLMTLFIIIIIKTFFYVGQSVKKIPPSFNKNKFFLWAVGSSLFAHAATCISVAYFDQSFLFLYLIIAAISSIWSYTHSQQANR